MTFLRTEDANYGLTRMQADTNLPLLKSLLLNLGIKGLQAFSMARAANKACLSGSFKALGAPKKAIKTITNEFVDRSAITMDLQYHQGKILI